MGRMMMYSERRTGQSAIGLTETTLTFADDHVTISQLPATTNGKPIAQNEDAIYVQTVFIGTKDVTVSITATAKLSPVRAEGFIATQPVHQKSIIVNACPAQA